MEEEVEGGGTREDFLSEDDHSPTDASEDSVEVRVQPIRAHHPHRPPTPPTPPAHHKFHKFRKHYSALRQEYPVHAARASPAPASPPASPVEPHTGAAPLSPGTRAAARNRRKPAEPRRLCHEAAPKRPHSPDPPRAAKAARTDGATDVSEKSAPSSPSPGAPPLLQHHPLLSSFRRPPMGAFPPLLIPPAWPPVTAQWGYPRVVNPLGWAGLTPGLTPALSPHHYPMLLPHPYPLPRPLLPSQLPPASPPPKSPPPRGRPRGARAPRRPAAALPVAGAGRRRGRRGRQHAATRARRDDDDTIHALLQPSKQKQRNYKNMTRERRIEANARERNRVHTISAAFEKLRTSVPAYSHNQKLSKLSVLRIACSYILSLSRLAGHDYSAGGTEPSFSECVDLTTRTIQVEGKAKKKRDE
nr:protein atonal homolog 8-like [Penaeus vannamei]